MGYDAAVAAYAHASGQLSGLTGEDFRRAWAECERRRQACRSASNMLREHISSDRSISRQRDAANFSLRS